MKRASLLLFFVLGIIYIDIHSQSKKNRAYWIENSGFFIETQSGDILIDGILENNNNIALAKGKFANVRLIFVSHIHRDHFNAKGTLNHLKNNLKAKLIITPEAFKRLEFLGLSDQLKSRIFALLPSWHTSDYIESEDFKIDILQFKHTGVQNIGFALKGNGISIIYLNGTISNQALIEKISSTYKSPDILITNKWSLFDKSNIESIKENFNPIWLFMAHHSGKNDNFIKNNGGIYKIENNMSIGSMKGKIFKEKFQYIDF